MTEKKSHSGDGLGGFFRKAFMTGLFLCLPISLTAYIIVWLVNLMASPARGFLRNVLDAFGVEPQTTPLFDAGVTLLSALTVVVVIALVGFVSSNLFGKFFFGLVEKFLVRVPMVSSIYSAIKQIIDTFSIGEKKTFSRAVLVEFPRRECWTVGFVTHEGETQFSRLAGTPLIHVFVPTTPNPTGGYMIFVPSNEVKMLDVSVAEAMNMIVSGGALVPGETPAKDAPRQ